MRAAHRQKMPSGCLTTIGARAGLTFFMWRKHRLSVNLASFELVGEEHDEDGGEVLNWTAKLAQTTVRSGPALNFGFSLSQKQMIEMGTFVPDELISNLLTCRRYTTFTGAVLFADVSGFTPLCEKYSKYGSVGAYRLTATLNRYIGAMVDLIHTFGGDLLKFSGDAFLASWHVRINEYLYHKIHDAISCAMHIQYTLGNFVTDVGLQLKVKLAIAAGNFTFCVIGNESSGATYVIVGLPILEVKKAESLCKSGDTVVAHSAWSFLIPHNYNYQELGRGYVKIKQILYDPKSPKRKIFDFDPHFLKHEQNRRNNSLGFENNFRSEFFAKKVMKVSASLRPFIISPVLQQIEASQSLDYLVEMRRVTIMFINLIPNTSSIKNILTLVDETYRSILRSVTSKLGLINKVCLFDKDIMYLVIFGLKGYKDKDEGTRALRSAHEIHKNVSDFKDVKSISIGITMGTTYCGVVGHPLRKEFTVIGAPVNKAARLMCAFKGIVSCDASVAFSSRLPVAFFEKMQPIYLKGIVGPVSDIFKYEEVEYSALTVSPIIRRNNLINKFIDMLNERSPYKAMIIIGDPRVGKSRVLMELAERARKAGWRPLITPLNKKIVSHFCFLQKVISIILDSSSRMRMKKLLELYKNDECFNMLYKLNSYFDVKFSVPFESQDSEENYAELLYKKTLHKIFEKDVILIDDAEGLDSESWKILQELPKIPGILVVITLPSALEGIEACVSRYLRNPVTTVIRLENLPRKYIAPLVCQMLDVEAAPRKLIRNLYKISSGIPGWVQAFLLSYVEAGSIYVGKESPEKFSSRRSYYVVSSPNDKSARCTKEGVKVCKLIDRDLKKDGIPPTFDDVIMATFDNLTPFKQLMLKCGAILGKEFRRSELEAVMDWPFNLALALGVKNLFEIDILCCATRYDPMDHLRRRSTHPSPIAFRPHTRCHCDDSVLKGRYGRLPKYALCNFMSFRFELLRATIYQVIPVNQRNEFHMRAYNYVRQQIMKCQECLNYEVHISLKKMTGKTYASSVLSNPKQTILSPTKLVPSQDRMFGSEIRRGAVMGGNKGVTFSDTFSESNSRAELDDYSVDSDPSSERLIGGDVFRTAALSNLLSGDSRRTEELQSKFLEELPLYIPHVVNCSCNEVATRVYKKLLYHADAADAKVEKLKVLVEFGIHYVKYSNFLSAYDLLKEALDLCEEIISNFKSFENQEEKKNPDTKKKKKSNFSAQVVLFEKEKAECFFGICCTYLGYMRQGIVELSSAANVDWVTYFAHLMTMALLKVKALPENWKEKQKNKFGFLSFAFASLAQIHFIHHDFAEAEYAAKTAVTYARIVNRVDFLCVAYSTYIEVCLHIGKYKRAKKIEKEALHKCCMAFKEKDVWDVLWLGLVFTTIFKGRLYRGEVHKTAEVAKASLRAAATFRACEVERFIYPPLIITLANQKKLLELAIILHNILTSDREYSAFEASRAQRLYLKLNLLVLTEIGYCMEHPIKMIQRVSKSFKELSKPQYKAHHTSARKCLVLMSLWYLRRKEFQEAELWRVKPHDGNEFLMENIPSTLKLIQGEILWLVHCINRDNEMKPDMQMELEARVDALEKFIRKRQLFLLPQALHMKAYKSVICFDYERKVKDVIPGLADLRAALKISKEHANINYIAWIQQSMTEWYSQTRELINKYREMDHLDSNIKIVSLSDNYEMYHYQPEDIFYHLPLPKLIVKKLIDYLSVNEEMQSMVTDYEVDHSMLFYGEAK